MSESGNETMSFMCDWSVSRYYLGQRSNILLVDPEIMKQIAVKEFNSFVEREVTGLASFPGLPLSSFSFFGLHSVLFSIRMQTEEQKWGRPGNEAITGHILCF